MIKELTEMMVIGALTLIGMCQYCERSRGLYKYGAVYEKDIPEFEMYRG